MAAQSVNPELITLAREARGMTQMELAAATSLSQAYISKAENGVLEITDDRLQVIAAALRYPPAFFVQTDRLAWTTCLHHRKRQTMPITRLRAIHAQINIARIQTMRLLQGVEIDSPFEFPRMDVHEYESPEEIAQLARAHWNLPMGPIANLVCTIEAGGGIVLRCDFRTNKLDAVSQWAIGCPPFFFVNGAIPGDRLRWTLAHEVGHILMHMTPSHAQESEADRFAAEFLMPAREIRAELERLTLPKLADLKERWKVSMQALIRRAHQLGAITERQQRSFFMRFSQLGYRKAEPFPILQEEPSLIREVINIHRTAHRYTVADLSLAALMSEEEFREGFLLEGPEPREPRRLHAVN